MRIEQSIYNWNIYPTVVCMIMNKYYVKVYIKLKWDLLLSSSYGDAFSSEHWYNLSIHNLPRTLASRLLEDLSFISSSRIWSRILAVAAIVFKVILSPGRLILRNHGSHCKNTTRIWKSPWHFTLVLLIHGSISRPDFCFPLIELGKFKWLWKKQTPVQFFRFTHPIGHFVSVSRPMMIIQD